MCLQSKQAAMRMNGGVFCCMGNPETQREAPTITESRRVRTTKAKTRTWARPSQRDKPSPDGKSGGREGCVASNTDKKAGATYRWWWRGSVVWGRGRHCEGPRPKEVEERTSATS